MTFILMCFCFNICTKILPFLSVFHFTSCIFLKGRISPFFISDLNEFRMCYKVYKINWYFFSYSYGHLWVNLVLKICRIFRFSPITRVNCSKHLFLNWNLLVLFIFWVIYIFGHKNTQLYFKKSFFPWNVLHGED